MNQQARIRIPRQILERLQRYGQEGQTYADILSGPMDIADRERFVEEQIRRGRDSTNRIRATQV